MKKYLIILIVCLLFLTGCVNKTQSKDLFYMDTVINVKLYNISTNKANDMFNEIEDLYRTYDTLTDRYDEDSLLYKINNDNFKELKIDSKLYDLIKYGKDFYLKSNHLFNINLGSVIDLWRVARNHNELPNIKDLKKIDTDINQIELKPDNIIVNHNQNIDLGGIAKGYTTNLAANLLKDNGVNQFIINAGGNVAVGDAYNGLYYRVGVQSPNDSSLFITLKINNKAIVTSGGYERYYEIRGVKYSHIINPKTLYPSNYMKSVTIISDDSALADLLSTTLFLMPVEEGKEFIKDYQVEVIWYTNDNQIIKTDGVSQYE